MDIDAFPWIRKKFTSAYKAYMSLKKNIRLALEKEG